MPFLLLSYPVQIVLQTQLYLHKHTIDILLTFSTIQFLLYEAREGRWVEGLAD